MAKARATAKSNKAASRSAGASRRPKPAWLGRREAAAKKLQPPALTRLRKLCLSLPQTSETLSWGHPNFRAGKRMFVTFEQTQARPSIAFHVSSFDVRPYEDAITFFLTPYGRGQWRSVWADEKLDWQVISELVRRSYESVATPRMLSVLAAS